MDYLCKDNLSLNRCKLSVAIEVNAKNSPAKSFLKIISYITFIQGCLLRYQKYSLLHKEGRRMIIYLKVADIMTHESYPSGFDQSINKQRYNIDI